MMYFLKRSMLVCQGHLSWSLLLDDRDSPLTTLAPLSGVVLHLIAYNGITFSKSTKLLHLI